MSAQQAQPKYPILDKIEVAEREIANWRSSLDILSKIANVPAALIMRVHASEIEVFVTSQSPGNVYHRGEKAPLDSGLYCETVMDERRELLIPNALKDPLWDKNPDIKLGMISYCGLPLTWPEGEIFGTICILDKQENAYSPLLRDLLAQFRDNIQFRLDGIYQASVERKRAGASLAENELKYRALFENAEGAILLFAEGRWVDCNAKATSVFGATREQIIGAHPSRFSPPTQPDGRHSEEEAIKLINLAYSTGPQVFEWEHCRMDGTTFSAEVNLSRVDLGGTPHIQAIVRDVTDRKRANAEHELNAQRVNALLILNQMKDAPLQKITDFALEEAVRLTQSTIGYLAFLNEDESVLTMHSWSKAAMAECAIIDKPIVYPLATTGLWGEAVRQRRPVITNDYAAANPLKKGCPRGHVLVKRHMNIPVFDGSRIVLVAGVGNKEGEYDQSAAQQLTLIMEGVWKLLEHKRVTGALEAEAANLDAIFESSPVGMMILDETTKIVRVNAAIAALSGGSRSDMLQHRPGNALRCVHSATDPRGCGHGPECPLCPARKGIEGLIANGGTISGAELPLQLVRNGVPQEVWLRIGAEPILMNGRRHLCVAIEDVTSRKRAEKELGVLNAELEQRVAARTIELQASTKELEAFAYSVSHDLRAPLRAIDGFSLALVEDCEASLDADGKDHLRRIRAATQRMGILIDDMLRLSRITRTEMLLERVDLTGLAWSVVDEVKRSQPERLVHVKIADGLVATADRKLMRIALENLLGNAWKFTGKQPEAAIEFGSIREGGETAFFVRDNGAGFDMAYADKLFRPFQRLHSVEEFPGTGIGLGTVQRIMQRHGGKAWAEGKVGKGATFYFRFASEQ